VIRPAAATLAQLAVPDMDAKLALAEFLLSNGDLQASARRAVDWLAAHAGVEQAAVAVAEPGTGPLLLIAEHGISSSSIVDFALSRDDQGHPLVAALDGRDAVFFSNSSRLPFRAPIDGRAFHAVPLRGDEDAVAHGILLASSSGPDLPTAVSWVARMLGRQVSRVLSRERLAETRFGQERMLLYSIINAVTDPILLTDTEGKLIIANSHAEKLFAAPEDSSEGWRRAVALNNMLFSAALSTSAVAQTELARRELLLVDPLEGSDLLFELLSSRAKDERQGTYVVSVLRNVTDLARAKEEIEESYRTLRVAQAEVRDERHRLDLIIDSVADPILVTDEEGDIVLMNKPAERLFNVPASAAESAQRRVRANGANLTSFVSNVLTRSGEQRYRGEIQLLEPETGRPSPVEGLAGQILSEQGELMWVVTILHDLTEAMEKARLFQQLKEAYAEVERKVQEATTELAEQNELLRRQHIALEQASALKSQFLANMSHEFRTPLNAILGYTHMLLNGVSGQVTDPQRKSLSRIDSNSRHLLALINDILDITRIEAGRMPLNVTTFGIPELVDEVMAELEPIVKRSNLAVRPAMPRGLPRLRSDRQKVKQIVLNLLSNALKFTPSGSVIVAAEHDAKTRHIVIKVTDTGVGIPLDDQKKVFEDFRQLDSSPARGYGGTGLGLSICRRLAQMLGGTIDLESAPGSGSTFMLRVPARMRRR
jgi:PAS domain S-box-containing protein